MLFFCRFTKKIQIKKHSEQERKATKKILKRINRKNWFHIDHSEVCGCYCKCQIIDHPKQLNHSNVISVRAHYTMSICITYILRQSELNNGYIK